MTAETLKLTVLSPIRKVLESQHVQEVTLTTSEGMIQILPGHVSMLGSLNTGEFQYTPSTGQVVNGVISTGFFEIVNNEVRVISETLEFSHEIDIERAKKAQGLAESKLLEASLEPGHFRKYQLKLQRALVRQQVAARRTN